MEITYLGYDCIKVKSKSGLTVLFNPIDSNKVGIKMVKEMADVVVSTVPGTRSVYEDVVTGPATRPTIFDLSEQGEYEIAEVEYQAIAVGSKKVLMISMRMDGMNLAYLGGMSEDVKESQIEKMGSVDILIVPVGGKLVMSADKAVSLIADMSPSIVIPVAYKTETMIGEYAELDEIKVFLDKNKLPVNEEILHKLKLDKSSLPDDTQIQVMN
jgi:L-ascorbate metabolism protein UlaG (beta-lactamase superfamily)